jgi:ferritin-like metal-binding protein YciE
VDPQRPFNAFQTMANPKIESPIPDFNQSLKALENGAGRNHIDKLSYMKSQRDGSSSRRELVDSSRKILFTNIQIMEKKKEAEVIKGDLISETERVREARFQFDLDTERFN